MIQEMLVYFWVFLGYTGKKKRGFAFVVFKKFNLADIILKKKWKNNLCIVKNQSVNGLSIKLKKYIQIEDYTYIGKTGFYINK